MAGQITTLDAIVRAELAIEIMNQARGLVSERVAAIEANDPAGAEALRAKRRELLAVQNRIRVGDPEQIEAVIAEWGPRVKDAAAFWREL
ncbi:MULTISPECIES: hypothetical protein [Chelativorans]|jgi:hypothetical protein|uniref:Uncharacterized protein n=1 Tax=Chelativorans sp. (strain BNC1) TaxID=266779 RepID=Q11MR4_CHESB|nr:MULTISPECIES: hypothetical protein [Chelativorans]MCB1461512.1 hypothetical protein [Nitratireductor sp.]